MASPFTSKGDPQRRKWAQLVKNPCAMPETWIRSLVWEDPMEKGKTTHSSILTWRIQGLYSPLGQSWTQLSDPDNHDGVITHLEPDTLECEIKWALGSITKNKASGGDGIPAELFQILKDDAVKVLYSICQQIWKTQLWPQD